MEIEAASSRSSRATRLDATTGLAELRQVELPLKPIDSQSDSSGSVELQDNLFHFLQFRIQPFSQTVSREEALIDK